MSKRFSFLFLKIAQSGGMLLEGNLDTGIRGKYVAEKAAGLKRLRRKRLRTYHIA